ncbi:MAG: protein phosphatase 2C domain-containing protein [Thermoplasmata archaeon]|nr:protein phosphatase 2C domain-containing protein [Thermoplasmata archaeon]
MKVDMPLTEGEDAPPFAGEHCVVVCDGMGSGSQRFTVDGEDHTHAYYASRQVSQAVSGFLEEAYEEILATDNLGAVAYRIKVLAKEALSAFSEANGIVLDGSVKGSTIRLMPTTLASCIFSESGGEVDAVCFWAGDSRCYYLDADGLHQVSEDDSRVHNDAMDDLFEDSAMSNVINLSSDFRINWCRFRAKAPCMIVAASDGVFGYLYSPMHMESMLLPRGEGFDIPSSVEAVLVHKPFDDRSMAAIMVGMDESTYPAVMAERTAYMDALLAPLDDVMRAYEEDLELRSQLRSADMSDKEMAARYSEVKNRVRSGRKAVNDGLKAIWLESYKAGYEAAVDASGDSDAWEEAMEPVEVPAETPVEAPVTEPVETPVETPVEEPVEAPAETPAPVREPVSMMPDGILEVLAAWDGPGKKFRMVCSWEAHGGVYEATFRRSGSGDKCFVAFARPAEADYLAVLSKVMEVRKGLAIPPMTADAVGSVTVVTQTFTGVRVPASEYGTIPPEVRERMTTDDLLRTIRALHGESVIHGCLSEDSIAVYRDGGEYRAVLTGWQSCRACTGAGEAERESEELKRLIAALFG